MGIVLGERRRVGERGVCWQSHNLIAGARSSDSEAESYDKGGDYEDCVASAIWRLFLIVTFFSLWSWLSLSVWVAC